MTYSIWPAAKVDQPGQQEIFESVNRMEAEGFDPYEDETPCPTCGKVDCWCESPTFGPDCRPFANIY